MAQCPACGGAFAEGTFCPRDGTRLVDDLASGQVLDDRYRLVREVGAGAMGVVYEAEHVHIQRRVAVKILKYQFAGNPDAIKRMEREAQLTSELGHPNIVQCRDFGYSRDGRVYLVMEWLDGETLETRLEREGVDVPTAVEIAIQTCAALAEAHACDVIHRDLKPANLFLARDREGKLRVKVLDFGIAKLSEAQSALTATGVVIGTPNYMSPEQAIGEAVDARADIYALGVILYEMLAGTVPFRGDSALSVLHQHSMRMPITPSETAPERAIPAALERIVMRCLEKRPADRYASAAALGNELGSLRAGTEPNASPTPQARATVPARDSRQPDDDELAPVRLPPRRMAVVAVGIAVAAVVLGWITLRGRGGGASVHDGGAVVALAIDSHDSPDAAVSTAVDAARAGSVDAVASTPIDASSTVVAVPCSAKHFTCSATLSTTPIAGALFQVEVTVNGRDSASAKAIAAGQLDGRIEIKDKRTHTPVFEATTMIDAAGRWTSSVRLERAIAYHVHVDLLDGGKEIDEASLADLTVLAP